MPLLRTEQSRDKLIISKRVIPYRLLQRKFRSLHGIFLQVSMPKDKIDFLTSAFVTGAKCSRKTNTVQLWSNGVYYM